MDFVAAQVIADNGQASPAAIEECAACNWERRQLSLPPVVVIELAANEDEVFFRACHTLTTFCSLSSAAFLRCQYRWKALVPPTGRERSLLLQ